MTAITTRIVIDTDTGIDDFFVAMRVDVGRVRQAIRQRALAPIAP